MTDWPYLLFKASCWGAAATVTRIYGPARLLYAAGLALETAGWVLQATAVRGAATWASARAHFRDRYADVRAELQEARERAS